MTDIFFSYAKEDRWFAETLVPVLETEGGSVWWDTRIPVGRRYERYIQDRLDESTVVVVLSSDHSVPSPWVEHEAGHGLERDALFPILIADVSPPVAFRQHQAANLVGWTAGDASPQLNYLISDLRDHLGTGIASDDSQLEAVDLEAHPAFKALADRVAQYEAENQALRGQLDARVAKNNPQPSAVELATHPEFQALTARIEQFEAENQTLSARLSDALRNLAQQRAERPAISEAPVPKDPDELPTPGASIRDVLQGGQQGPEMVFVPGGTFLMGSPWSEAGARPVEHPQHEVNVQPFLLGRYPVTFQEYDVFANETGKQRPSDATWGRADRPVINVSWHDAQAYVEWLSQQTGHAYQLPREAQWEYAARAGTRSAYWWGDEISTSKVQYRSGQGEWKEMTAPVGSFEANPFGLFDMHGNVWEWATDCWNDSYDSAPTDGSAWETGDCSRRVVRGGSWFNTAEFLRSAVRVKFAPDAALNRLGFRLLRTP